MLDLHMVLLFKLACIGSKDLPIEFIGSPTRGNGSFLMWIICQVPHAGLSTVVWYVQNLCRNIHCESHQSVQAPKDVTAWLHSFCMDLHNCDWPCTVNLQGAGHMWLLQGSISIAQWSMAVKAAIERHTWHCMSSAF